MWLAATDGFNLLAIAIPGTSAIPYDKYSGVLERSFGKQGDAALVSLPEFAEWAGPLFVAQVDVCSTCDGRGSVPHECDCPHCYEASDECPECAGARAPSLGDRDLAVPCCVFGVQPVDKRRVAVLLNDFAGDLVRVTRWSTANGSPWASLRIDGLTPEGQDAFALLVPMSSPSTPPPVLAFPLAQTEAA